MKVHDIKIMEMFVDPILTGDKNFEIRENDRGFQKGDYIHFMPVKADGVTEIRSEIYKRRYKITYVLIGWGLQNCYVALGIHDVTGIESEEK